MFDYMLNDEERRWRDRAMEFAKTQADPDYLRAMDRDEIRFPRELYTDFAHSGLLGLLFSRECGGQELSWIGDSAVQGEIGHLGTAAGCAFVMPSIVGEAITRFGSPKLKRKRLAPMLRGELVSAEALTEPRGGADFSGTTSVAPVPQFPEPTRFSFYVLLESNLPGLVEDADVHAPSVKIPQ